MKEKVWKQDAATGRLRLRSGVVLAFFLPTPLDAVVEPMRAAFEAYLAQIPEGSLRWSSIGAASESWKPVDKNSLRRCLEQLDPAGARKRPLTYFELRDGEHGGDPPGYGVMAMGHPVDPKRLDKRSVIQFHYPSEVIADGALEGFVAQAAAMAKDLPLCSGYASPTLGCATTLGWREAKAPAKRYPGYDVQDNANGRREIDDLVRGARWLTFLGPALVKKLGGAAKLKKQLGDAIPVTAVGSALMLRAGQSPELGDAGRMPEDSPLLALARVLEPHTLFQESALYVTEFAGRDENRLRAWERRFLDQ